MSGVHWFMSLMSMSAPHVSTRYRTMSALPQFLVAQCSALLPLWRLLGKGSEM
jgi:hypothetical protein